MMNLSDRNILIAAQYAPPYGGNFIPSLRNLVAKLQAAHNVCVHFVFPKAAEDKEWAKELAADYNVIFTGSPSCLISASEAKKIVRSLNPCVIYTHFEGYDNAFLPYVGKETAIVWHMHDTLYYQKHPLKKIYQFYAFWKHYGKPAITHKVGAIAVCEHELRFIRPLLLRKRIPQLYLPNAISPERIRPAKRKADDDVFTFLAFGGRNVQKRNDLIFKAGEILAEKGLRFKVTITGGTDTDSLADSIYKGSLPAWLEITPPVKDINTLFDRSDCFISSSVHETFSYAVAEASIAGLPVIQSNIEGTAWNAGNPSVFEFESGNAESLAEAMTMIMTFDRDKLDILCRQTSERNRKALSLDLWSDNIIDFFKRID
jgi:glycosyltransferase involved in cell wall biosynthesis